MGGAQSLPNQLIIGTPNNAAELNIESGAQVTTTNSGVAGRVLIGASEGGGSINVTGANSLLAAGGRLEFRNGTDIRVGAGASATAVEDLSLGGSLNLDGSVTVGTTADISAAGTLTGSGSIATSFGVNNSGTVAPGNSAGTLTVNGDYRQQAAGTLEIEIGGTAPGEFDVLSVTGIADFQGTLDLSLLGSYVPDLGDAIDFVEYVAPVRLFDSILQPAGMPVGMEYRVNPFPTFLRLEAVPELDGDFNLDGNVNGSDFLSWQRNPSIGKLSDWQNNYGASSSLAAASTTVPEPATLLLAALGFATLVNRRVR